MLLDGELYLLVSLLAAFNSFGDATVLTKISSLEDSITFNSFGDATAQRGAAGDAG